MAASLHIAGIRKVFGKGDKAVEVLKRIDIDVAPGEFLILVGPSGCGKSTLLNIIAGLEDPTEGELAHCRQERHRHGPGAARHCHGVPELRLVPHHERGRQHWLCAGDAQGAQRCAHQTHPRSGGHAADRALLDRRPAQLSGGQRQRVAMGRALARDPQLFLFDEPLSNLDAKLRVEMRAEIKRLHHVSGITSVYVTHDQIEAMTLGSRIAVMKDGILQQIGTPDEIYRTPANTYVAGASGQFIGSPRWATMNFITHRRRGLYRH
jgi:multiple sugar transport system ATP-binding protein